jgi:hypothetical protein
MKLHEATKRERTFTDPALPDFKITNNGGPVFTVWFKDEALGWREQDSFTAYEREGREVVSLGFAKEAARTHFENMKAEGIEGDVADLPAPPAEHPRFKIPGPEEPPEEGGEAPAGHPRFEMPAGPEMPAEPLPEPPPEEAYSLQDLFPKSEMATMDDVLDIILMAKKHPVGSKERESLMNQARSLQQQLEAARRIAARLLAG